MSNWAQTFQTPAGQAEARHSEAPNAEITADSLQNPTSASVGLVGFVTTAFQRNADHRMFSGVEEKLLRALRMVRGEFSPEELKKMREAGIPEEMFTPITDVKRRAAMAMILEIFNAPGDKPWSLSPTPIPDVPSSVAREAFLRIIKQVMEIAAQTGRIPSSQEIFKEAQDRVDDVFNEQMAWARKRAARMERKVHDQLIEGGWVEAFKEYVNFLTTYGTALIIGPVERVVACPRCKEGKLGVPVYTMQHRRIPVYEAVNPWDAFPAPAARRVEDGTLCIRVRYTSDELSRFISECEEDAKKDHVLDGWLSSGVRKVLSIYPNGGYRLATRAYDSMRRRLENDGMVGTVDDCVLEGIRCFASVRGQMIRNIGVVSQPNGDSIDAMRYYNVETIVMADTVVYCRVIDSRIDRPVSKGVFYEAPDSWWGDAPADKLVSSQKMMNSALRNIITNMVMSSGPMFWTTGSSRLADKSETALTCRPYKMFAFLDGIGGSSGPPIGTIDIASHMPELIGVYEKFKAQADEDSGIPAYTYGSNISGGAGRTASGLAMLSEAATRVIKMVISGTDMDVSRRIIKLTVVYNLLFDDDASLKGDCQVNPSGVMGQILKEQESMKRQQLLALVSNNPMLANLVGVRGMAALLRPETKALGINPDEILPSESRMRDLELLQMIREVNSAAGPNQGAAEQPQPGGSGAEQPTDAEVIQTEQPAIRRGVAVARGIQQDPNRAAMVRGGGKVRERGGAA